MIFWCPTCGVVWADKEAPLCRHFVIYGPAVRRMEDLPDWHPFASQLDAEEAG